MKDSMVSLAGKIRVSFHFRLFNMRATRSIHRSLLSVFFYSVSICMISSNFIFSFQLLFDLLFAFCFWVWPVMHDEFVRTIRDFLWRMLILESEAFALSTFLNNDCFLFSFSHSVCEWKKGNKLESLSCLFHGDISAVRCR